MTTGLKSKPLATTMAGSMAKPRKKPDLSTYSKRVGARVRSLREVKGHEVTAEQLRAALARQGHNVTIGAIYHWENGTRDINPNLYPALAKIFGFADVREFLPPK